ncbi:MAG: class I SAM-dependent methyltransferase [Ilumatobacteraceae bacterium]
MVIVEPSAVAPDPRDHREVNRTNWASRVAHHAASIEYGFERFAADPAHLSDVVRFDLSRLGAIAGLDVVHLQCHIGTDTLSLARLGATVTGLDFSTEALEAARRLSRDAGPAVEYVESDVYSAPEVLGAGRFDLVYTGVGALNWLPGIRRWADVVAALLRPGGRLFLREGHPVLWTLADPRDDGVVAIEYPYFESTGVAFHNPTTYVTHAGEVGQPWAIEFNHGLAEIITAVMGAGLELLSIEEHDSVPWPALGDQMEELPNGEFRLVDRPERLPHSYTLQARKR